MKDVRFLLQKANQHIKDNNLRDAKSIYIQIIRASPCIEATYGLALIYGQEKDYANAEKQFKSALKYNKASDIIWNNLGIAQKYLGKNSDAIKSLKKAIDINNANTNARNALGNIYQNQGDLKQAEKLYQESYKLAPNEHVTLNNLASIYIEKCDYRNALSLLNKAISINRNYYSTHYNLGSIQQSLGNYKTAISYFRNAERIDPGAVGPKSAIASCYELMSEYSKAIEIIEPLTIKAQVQTDVAVIYAKLCDRTNKHRKGIKILINCIKNRSLSNIDSRKLHYSLADLYDRVSEYDLAYKHYKLANNTVNNDYNKIKQEKYFRTIKDFFHDKPLEEQPLSNNQSNKPIFILGMPRSGTSLIEQILSSHSKVHGLGELTYISDISNQLSNIKKIAYPNYLNTDDIQLLDSLAEQYLNRVDINSQEYKYYTDKMPHNFIYIGLIKSLFRNCKIIHCSRNPLDICLSIYFHDFNVNHPYSNDLINLGQYYNMYHDLMSFWKNRYNNVIFDIKYEDIVENPKENILSLLDYLELDWEDDCLHFYKNERTVNTPSYNQVKKPLYKTSSNRWKNYADYIKPLINAIDDKYLL